MNTKPRTCVVRHTVEVTDDGYNTVAKVELAESVVLSVTEPKFDPAVALTQELGRDAANKACAQVVAYETLEKAQAASLAEHSTVQAPTEPPF